MGVLLFSVLKEGRSMRLRRRLVLFGTQIFQKEREGRFGFGRYGIAGGVCGDEAIPHYV